MTLNITVLTKSRIYQSSDFRLTSLTTGDFDSDVMKLVTLHYPSFDGFVSYTGLARGVADTSDTAEKVTSWLEGQADLQFHELVEILRSKAIEFVTEISEQEGATEKLTLIVAAFVNSRPTLAVVSNFESADGRRWQQPSAELRTSWRSLKSTESSYVHITGMHKTVSADEESRLRSLIGDATDDPGRVRISISEINREAAKLRSSKGAISEECTVISFDVTGSGLQDIPLMVGVETRSLTNGISFDMAGILRSLGVQGAVLRGAAFGTNKPGRDLTDFECDRELQDFGRSGFTLQEIARVTRAECRALAINDHGIIVGSSRPADRVTYQYWLWDPQSGIEELPIQTMSPSAAINRDGLVAINVQAGDRTSHPLVWRNGDTYDLEIPEGMGEANARCINPLGFVAGSISISLDVSDGCREKPAVWDRDGSISILADLFGANSGHVVSINEDGIALVCANTCPFGWKTILWNTRSGEVRSVSDQVIPIFLSDVQAIVGIGSDVAGAQFPVLSHNTTTWTLVSGHSGYVPNSANQALNIVGQVPIDGFMTPWVSFCGGTPLLLPTYKNHQCHTGPINNNDTIVGHITTDEEQHVVIWQPLRKGP